MTVGGWYYWLNALENLGYSKLGANVVFLGAGAVSGILAAAGWGRLIDRWGRRPVLMIATFGTMFSAMPWFFLTRHTPGPAFVVSSLNFLSRHVGAIVGRGEWLWVTADTPLGAYLGGAVACTIGGACWSGVNLAQVGVTLGFADGNGRSKYVAASAVLISIGGVLGGVVGGTVAQSLSYFHYQANPVVLGPFAWNNWHATFALSILSRVAGVMWLFGMEDPGAVRLRHVARAWRANAYNAVSTRMFYPLRVFGWRRNGRNGNGGKQDTTKRERQ
jgi:MFS family permease